MVKTTKLCCIFVLFFVLLFAASSCSYRIFHYKFHQKVTAIAMTFSITIILEFNTLLLLLQITLCYITIKSYFVLHCYYKLLYITLLSHVTLYYITITSYFVFKVIRTVTSYSK